MNAMRSALGANPVEMNRELFDHLSERSLPAEDVTYTDAAVGSVSGVWCTPARLTHNGAVLYLHGGAYVMGSAHAFRHFGGQIASLSGIAAFIPDYRLAPENPFPAAVDDVVAAYRGLAGKFGIGRVAIVGDSAGGGLAMALLQTVKGPACGVLLSPWVDLALTGESLTTKASEDPILTRLALEGAARQYLGRRPSREPKASPIYGPMVALPAIQIHVGSAEILLDDSLRLGAATSTEVHVWDGMPHVFPRLLEFEAAREALSLISSFIRAHLGAL
jgi:monoterpene epsilon-lactone hydrolase